MGWFPFKFLGSTEERRVNVARKWMENKNWIEATYALEEVDSPTARELLAECHARLVILNLSEWRAQTAAGNRSEAGDALSRARRFGATEEQIEAARRGRYDERPR